MHACRSSAAEATLKTCANKLDPDRNCDIVVAAFNDLEFRGLGSMAARAPTCQRVSCRVYIV